MQRPFLFAYLVLSLLFNSALGFPTALVPRGSSEGTSCNSIVNGCPNLDFDWHMNQQSIMQYTLDVISVSWVQDDTYQITIHVKGEENIDLKYLWSLEIIDVTGPEDTVQLYGCNEEDTYLIDNPTDFTATFEVYATQDVNSCQVWMSDFQIQFEYLQDSAAEYACSWEWGATSFSLSTGCDNYDDQGHSQTDFPGFYWNIDCDNNCAPVPTPSSSTTESSSAPVTSSTTESSSAPVPTPSSSTTESSSAPVPTPSSSTTESSSAPVPTPSSSTTESSSAPVTSSTTESSSAPAPTPSSSTTESSSAPVPTPSSSTTESSSAPVSTSEGTSCNSIVNGCPNLDFDWHMNQQSIMQLYFGCAFRFLGSRRHIPTPNSHVKGEEKH
ncbi:ASN_collapsed_G0027810.mRNA.1.CDS.1 [Saccharomyces cerevisiae]|nr:ASN_collapsed_G0027810.mRNA.1.CDS.1 [Saccharomyces cerevisiae]